jgi:hypothetical protein
VGVKLTAKFGVRWMVLDSACCTAECCWLCHVCVAVPFTSTPYPAPALMSLGSVSAHASRASARHIDWDLHMYPTLSLLTNTMLPSLCLARHMFQHHRHHRDLPARMQAG